MHAITLARFGGPEVMEWTEVPDPPPPPPGHVTIRVAAAGVNRADLVQRTGAYPPPAGESEVLGLECSGEVVACGEGVEWPRAGDEVCALLAGGGYAELVTVAAGQVMPLPGGVGLLDAAGLPEVACTVWSNVCDVAHLRSGELLLVHGGASGIGTMAIQVARAFGARAAVTAGSEAKLARCRELGAEIAVNYHDEDFETVVRAATDGHGADIVLDTVGGNYLRRNVGVLAQDGRIVTIGLMGGSSGELDLRALMAKRGTVTATGLRHRPAQQKAAIVAGTVAALWPHLESGRIRPVIDRVLPITDAEGAHRVVAAGEHVGKVLLRVA